MSTEDVLFYKGLPQETVIKFEGFSVISSYVTITKQWLDITISIVLGVDRVQLDDIISLLSCSFRQLAADSNGL